MQSFRALSFYGKYSCFQVVFLLLIFTAGASAKNETANPSGNSKITSQICEKVLPSLPDPRDPLPGARRGPDRIVNGDLAPHMRYYMAALVSESRGFFCSASLLSEYWAMTAAHCKIDKYSTVVRAGGRNILDGTDIKIEDVFPHPSYYRDVKGTEENDLQLIKLKTPVPTNSKFFYVNSEPHYPAISSYARACGYGDTLGTASPNVGILREVDIPIQDSSVCQLRYHGINVVIKEESHICAGYDEGGCDSCYGDSGGPLFTFGKELILVQVGIVSFGFECALPLMPGVYTRLFSYIPWMTSVGAVFKTTSDGINIFENGVSSTNSSGNPSEGVHGNGSIGKPLKPGTSPGPGSTEYTSGDEEEPALEPKSSCFPANAIVTLENGEKKRIKNILVGDRVRVGPDEYSEVFMFTHRRRYGIHKFVKVQCQACNIPLLLSMDHVLSVNGVFKPAREVQIGDFIIKASGQASIVTHVSHVYDQGLFNPQTIDGRIVVNDVQVTTYTTAIDKSLAHALLTPLRFGFKCFKWSMSWRALSS